ncbi:MAG: hypothetical protein AAGE65_06485 [Planctomycetota bacterium]
MYRKFRTASASVSRVALAVGAASVAWVAVPAPFAAADSAVFNFTSNLTSYSGADALSPFIPGTAFNALVNGQGGFAGLASDDWLRFTGQIYLPDFNGDGTYEITPTNNVGGLYLHSPLLNRLEAVSLRTEGPLTQASLDAGDGRADGQLTANRDDIYLPDFTPNGTATVTVEGDDVTIDYVLNFTTLTDENAAFLRNGVTPTQIADLLAAAGQRFGSVGVNGTGTAAVQSAAIGSGDEDGFAFGGYSLFDAVVEGNLSNTIVPTTRGVIDNEIAAGNISSDGRSATNPATTFLTDPFAGESGTTFFFDLTGAGDLDASVALVPEPGAALAAIAGTGVLLRRRRG